MHGLHQVRSRDSSDPIIPNPVRLYKEAGPLRAWAYALALFVLALPLHSPDVWWHLSAGRWILAHLAVPRVDEFSFTRAGAPWTDFEWLAQAAFFLVHSAAGLFGLWALKGALLVAAFAPVDGLLRDKKASSPVRAAALVLWLCASLAQADLRVDLFSAAFFALLLRRLESGRASFLFGFGLFALWSNLHAGFVVGFALYAAYALTRRGPKDLGAEACGALLGSLMNPWGLGLWGVVGSHGADSVGRWVAEWGPVDWRMRFHRPLVAALIAGAVAARAARKEAPALAAAAGALALATAVSARFGVYFAACAAALLAHARLSRGAVLAGLSAATLLFADALGVVKWGLYSDAYVARPAVEWVVSQREALAPLKLFNTYEWGGYLGWTLGPGSKVYGDGRYLFHGQLPELQKALSGPEEMRAFVDRNGFDALLIRSYPTRFKGTLVYPDGTSRVVSRPWYASYLPRERWALVYWDDAALVFVDRNKVPKAWLDAHETAWARPGDDDAVEGAVAAGLTTRDRVAFERSRKGR